MQSAALLHVRQMDTQAQYADAQCFTLWFLPTLIAGLTPDFQCLKARGYKPFFTGATLNYRDGPVIRKCARDEANKVVAAAARAAQAATPPRVRQPRPQRNSVAIGLTEVCTNLGLL